MIENTPMVIDRYREATIALGYTGDSVLNSLSDIAMMALGFLAARRLPVWASRRRSSLVLELVPLLVIRDNLTLNVWMLLAPNDAIRAWQAAAERHRFRRQALMAGRFGDGHVKRIALLGACAVARSPPPPPRPAKSSAAFTSTTSTRR